MKHERNVFGRILAIALVAAGAALAATPSDAGPAIGVRTGVYTDADAGFVGAEALAPIGSSWYFNPNFEYAVADRGDLFTVNGDFHFDLVEQRPYTLWLGAGPAVIVRDTEPHSRRSDLGVNLIAGLGFRKVRFEPYVQTKATVADDSQFVLAFGVRF